MEHAIQTTTILPKFSWPLHSISSNFGATAQQQKLDDTCYHQGGPEKTLTQMY